MTDQTPSIPTQTNPETTIPLSLPPIQPSNHPTPSKTSAQGSAPTTRDEKMKLFLERKREKAKRPPSPSSSDSDQVPSPLKCYEEEKKLIPRDSNREAEEKANLDRLVRNIFLDLGEEEETEEVPLVRRPRSQQAHTEASGFELVERVEPRKEPSTAPEAIPEEVRKASPEVVKIEKEKDTDDTERSQ